MANTVKENAAKLQDDVKTQVSSIDTTPLTDAANKSQESLKNASESIVGSVAGEVQGGIQSLTQKFDQYSNKLSTTTVEGLITDGVQSLENMATDFVNGAIAGLTSKFASGVTVQFSEPDSNGIVYPIASSLKVEGGVDATVASILQLITGLGVDAGSLQKTLVDASPKGLLDAGKGLLVEKMGAFNGASAIATLTEIATESVLTVLEDATNGVLNSIKDVGDNTLNSIGKNITNIPASWDSDGVVTSVSTVTGTGANFDTVFDSAMGNMRNGLVDLRATISDNDNIKENVAGALSDVENLSGGKDGKTVQSAVDNTVDYQALYEKRGGEYRSLVQTKLAKDSQRGIIQSLNIETLTTVRKQIKAYAPSLVDADINRVIELCQGDADEFSQAVRLIYSANKQSYSSIRTFLKGIDTTIFNATRPPLTDIVFEEPYVIGSFDKTWNKGAGDPIFPYISSLEELLADIKNVKREVTEVVVHWTETHTNKNIGSEEINKYHRDARLDGIGYHYVIRRDGSLQRGRPVSLVGQHAPINSHNLRSIGIVFVGGINVPSGTPNSENFLSAQSLTRSQINTFDHFCRSIYSIFPGAQIVGHSNIDDDEFDPGFDVTSYVRANFGKKSKFTDPLTQAPFTLVELLTK